LGKSDVAVHASHHIRVKPLTVTLSNFCSLDAALKWRCFD